MPTYAFICDKDKSGCAHTFELQLTFEEYDKKLGKSRITCPECRKRKPVCRDYDAEHPHVSIPKTLGHYADRQQDTMSEDERHHKHTKNNEYRDQGESSWTPSEHGMIHK